mgnify:CR=1 FL=1
MSKKKKQDKAQPSAEEVAKTPALRPMSGPPAMAHAVPAEEALARIAFGFRAVGTLDGRVIIVGDQEAITAWEGRGGSDE